MSGPKGIGGILDQIVGAGDISARRQPKHNQLTSPTARATQDPSNHETGKPQGRPTARRGRPLSSNQQPTSRESKAKVTVWINQALVDEYRDWSWEARCSLSTLMQRAMLDYQQRHRAPSGS